MIPLVKIRSKKIDISGSTGSKKSLETGIFSLPTAHGGKAGSTADASCGGQKVGPNPAEEVPGISAEDIRSLGRIFQPRKDFIAASKRLFISKRSCKTKSEKYLSSVKYSSVF